MKELQLKLSKEEAIQVLAKIDLLLKEEGREGGVESFFNSKGKFDVADLNIYFKDYTYKEFMSWLILNYETVKKERLVEAVDKYADEVTSYILGELEDGKDEGDREYIFYFNKSGVYLQEPLIDGDYTIETPGSSYKLYICVSGGVDGSSSVLTCKTSFNFDLYKAAADWVEGCERKDDGGFIISKNKDIESVIDDVVGACLTPRRGSVGYPVYSLVMSDSQDKDSGFYKCGKEVPVLKI
jgi:hypothetical protein